MTRSLIAMLLAILCLTSAASEKRPVSAVDFVASPILSSPRLSPDGKLLLYRHIGVDWDENKSVARLRLKDVHTNALLAVPEPESAGESFSAGEWHPDGSGFALILKRDGDEHRQLYFFDHQSKQLTRLTQHANDIESFFWSVDGAHIFIIAESAQDPAQARLQEDEWVIAEYDDARHREIIQLDVATKTTREIVAGDYSVRRVSLSRDGAHLVYVRVPNHELNRSHEGDVWVTNIASGEHQRWTQNDFSEYDPQLASDGKTLAFMATVNAKGAPYYEDKVFVQRGRDATPERLLGDKAMEAIAFAWDADSSGLFIMANIGVSSQLFHYQLESGELTQVTDGSHSFRGWHYDVALDQHVARHVTADAPGDIVAIDASAKTITPLTRESRDWAAQFELPEQVAVSWRGRGRVTIEGVLVYPLGYEKDKRYPLVTITHGGPRSSSQFGSWNRSRYVSVLAGHGYAVLLPNHRGGTGYGDDFVRDMYGRYFRNAHHDVMDGIDAMVARGIADPDRLIAMGWSAGGHMVNKLITVTDRFAAASSGAGASDWLSMFGESDVRFPRTWVFGGTPWQRKAPLNQFRRDSVLQDSWRVTTPTLFFAGARDVRVPPTQSIMMYRGVRAANVPTALYLADGQPHNYRKPSYQLFKINRELAWYAEHALGDTYEPVLPAAAQPPLSTLDSEEPS